MTYDDERKHNKDMMVMLKRQKQMSQALTLTIIVDDDSVSIVNLFEVYEYEQNEL